MFINFYIARPTYCFIFVHTCGLTVVIKRICCYVMLYYKTLSLFYSRLNTFFLQILPTLVSLPRTGLTPRTLHSHRFSEHIGFLIFSFKPFYVFRSIGSVPKIMGLAADKSGQCN